MFKSNLLFLSERLVDFLKMKNYFNFSGTVRPKGESKIDCPLSIAMSMAQAEHIEHFYAKSSRRDNDRINRIREKCFLILNNRDHPYFSHIEFGNKWVSLYNGFKVFIKSILVKREINTEPTNILLESRGGQGNHFDVYVKVFYLDSVLNEVNFEFKFSSMPQFANLHDKERFITPTLAEFWYDNGYVSKMCEPYSNLEFPVPSREEYLKGAHQQLGSTSKRSFFRQFYEMDHIGPNGEKLKDSVANPERVKHVHDGIKEYLEKHGATIDISKLCKRMKETQDAKMYGIWNPKKAEFTLLEYTQEELEPTRFLRIENGNTIVLEAGKSEMHLLLRWKNTLGLCVPAWQISMRR